MVRGKFIKTTNLKEKPMKKNFIFTLLLLCLSFSLQAKDNRPLILISSYFDSGKSQIHVGSSYYNSVIRAGGVPLIMPVVDDKKLLERYVEMADGVVIIGGNDISPSYYGEEDRPELGKVEPEQDSSDFLLIELIRKAKLPVLAICRGAQAMNVAHGGSLYQDIPTQVESKEINHRQKENKVVVTHSVTIKKGSRFAKILKGEKSVMVNTFHHQAANKIGKGLEVVAWSEDGVVEGLESKNGLIVCPQFHPEGLSDDPNSIMINFFEDLVSKAKKHKK